MDSDLHPSNAASEAGWLESSTPTRWLGWSAFGCVVLAVMFWVGPYVLRADLFADDVAQHTFWLYRYANPALFPHDLSVDYLSSVSTAPWGYRALYAVLARLMDVGLAAKLVAGALLAVSGWLAWRLGTALVDDEHGALRGLLAVLTLCIMVSFAALDLLTAMAFQRTFALPISLFFLWALVAHRYRWVGVCLLAAALLYPPILPVMGLTAVVVWVREIRSLRRMPEHWIWNAALAVIALGIALADARLPPGAGPTATYAQALAMPEFGPAGRMMLYDSTRWTTNWLRDDRTGLGWTPRALLSMGLAWAFLYWRGRARQVPAAAWAMAITGVTMFFVARALMFHLYLPNRQSRWSLAVFGTALFATAGAAFVQWIIARSRRADPLITRRLPAAVALAAPLMVASAYATHAATLARTPVNTDLERAYAYIASLPPDTLIAAHPDLADFVPYRAHHSVLASTEEQLPFHLGYYNRLKPRVEASLRAAYATDWNSLDSVLAPYGAQAVLTGPPVWMTSSYYAPFDQLVRRLRTQGARKGFVLQHPPAERILFRSGDYYVVRVDGGHAP